MSDSSLLTGVMEDIGGPFSQHTLDALLYWADSEGVPESWNNPLATTYSGYGGADVNSAGVKSYPTEQDGIDATYATLQGGGYSAVVKAIRGNASWSDIWSAVNASPWCGGCQGGKYPVALYDAIQSGGGTPPVSAGGGAPSGGAPSETPASVDPGVLAGWSNLHYQAGPVINEMLDTLNNLR